MTNGGAAGSAASLNVSPARTAGESSNELERIERALAIIESCLCEMFPDDFFRRCAFAAFAARALLHKWGIAAEVVGGQFGAFVLTEDNNRLTIQGFEPGRERCPHFWVEAAGRLIDLGPYLLAFGSPYPVATMPAMAWELDAPLPASIRYQVQERFPADSRISPTRTVRDQCDAFVDRCQARADESSDKGRLPTWIATGNASLVAAAERGDPWALGARRFEQMAKSQPLPF